LNLESQQEGRSDKENEVQVIRCLLKWLLLTILVTTTACAQQKLQPSEAKVHVGETATVCGIVASSRYAPSTKGQPTFLNLDKPYPNHVFTVLIWGESRSKFGTPESDYRGKRICVTGAITEYRGVAEIVVNDPKQIKSAGNTQ
jgi:DNA/RNA endonuclease YhcR with UshA esterase domain